MIRTLTISLTISLTAALLCAAPARAVECPPDQRGENVQAPGPSENSGVSEEFLAAIDLAAYQLPGRSLRTRKFTVEPGGIIFWHDHAARPALTYIVRGEMTEFRATCRVPLVYRTGDVVVEDAGTTHWWRNDSAEAAVLVSTDLPPPQN